jgi:hypothetical protein
MEQTRGEIHLSPLKKKKFKEKTLNIHLTRVETYTPE